jgi:hypothetical protein
MHVPAGERDQVLDVRCDGVAHRVHVVHLQGIDDDEMFGRPAAARRDRARAP